MANDESSVDAVPHSLGTAAEDSSPQPEAARAPDSSARRRSQKPRPPRTRKEEPEEAVPSAESSSEAPAAINPDYISPAQAPKERRAPSRARKRAEPAAPAQTESPVVEIADTGLLPPEPPASPKPARGRTRRTAEKKAAEAPPTPPSETKQARPRGRRRRPEEEPAVLEPIGPPVAPVSEPGAPKPGPAPRKAPVSGEETARGARILSRRGKVELQVNGEPRAPVLFFGNPQGPSGVTRVQSEVRRAAAAGIHLYSTLVEVTCPLPPEADVYETLDSRLQLFLDADPEAYLMPRLVFVPAPGWMRQYPNEVSHYTDGGSPDPSIASNRFWTDAEHALASLIDHVGKTHVGERILGFHLERGEWFNPVENGYDRSFANREAFREWLRAKYKNNVIALRAAWFDGDVQFHTVEVPPLPPPAKHDLVLFEPRRQRRWIDFLEYTSDITAERLIALSKVVKAATNNRALVSVCYGYTFDFEHNFSGHLALDRVLAAPTIDLVSGPPSYRDREPGAAGSFPAPISSASLHGKLWVSEDDTKTYLAPASDSPDDFNPRLPTREATDQAHLRAIGKALAYQTGIAWMDLWGEGWLDSEEIWQRAGMLASGWMDGLKRRAGSPEVVALVDERSLFHVQRGPSFLKRILQSQREAFQRVGASVGFYLQSDLTTRTFPTDAKLYVFLNPYRLPEEQRAAIRAKLQNAGKTLVWVYAAGICDARGEPEESAHDMIGIALRRQPWSSETGSRIVNQRHPITEALTQREVGVRERLNPSFYVDDQESGLTILAEYSQSELPSIAVREMDGWRTVFCGEPALPADLVRGICRYAGVHLYTATGEDFVTAGNGWLMIHTTRDGNKTILLPPRTALYDVLEQQIAADEGGEFRGFIRGRTTRLFVTGSLDELRKLGLPGVERTRRRRAARGEAPLAPPEPATGEAAALPLPESIASEGEETPTEEERARRRRRRGGRGRGRRGRGGARPEGAAAPEGA